MRYQKKNTKYEWIGNIRNNEMKMSKSQLKQIIKEEISHILQTEGALDEIFGFSKDERQRKFKKKILKKIESGYGQPTHLGDGDAKDYLSAFIPTGHGAEQTQPIHRVDANDVAGAIAKKKFDMDLEEWEQKAYTKYFEGGYESERAAGTERREKEKSRSASQKRRAGRQYEKDIQASRERKKDEKVLKQWSEIVWNRKRWAQEGPNSGWSSLGSKLKSYIETGKKVKYLVNKYGFEELYPEGSSKHKANEFNPETIEDALKTLKQLGAGHIYNPNAPRRIHSNDRKNYSTSDYDITGPDRQGYYTLRPLKQGN